MTAIPTNVLASVDLGSNSFRLQICENHNGQLKMIPSNRWCASPPVWTNRKT